jgi:hypothetical protein
MAGDLERFLQEAAERLAQKVNQAQKPKQAARPPQRPVQPPSVRRAERAPPRLDPEIVDAEIIEPYGTANRRELGPDPLSNIDTRPELAQVISNADEKMSGHLHDVFDHDVMALKQASSALTHNSGGETDKKIDLQQRQRSVSPLVDMLRQPKTLRAAFIASEIFKPKF